MMAKSTRPSGFVSTARWLDRLSYEIEFGSMTLDQLEGQLQDWIVQNIGRKTLPEYRIPPNT